MWPHKIFTAVIDLYILLVLWIMVVATRVSYFTERGRVMQDDFLKTKPVLPLLLSMGLPMVFSMLINSLYNIIDSMYVARLGTDAIAALSIVFPLQNLTVAVSVGLGIGVNSVVSRAMGAGDTKGAEHAASIGMKLALIHSLVFIVIGLTCMPWFVGQFTRDAATLASGVLYGRIVLIFSMPYMLYLVLEKLFQSIGWMKTTMTIMIVGAVFNILLDPVMIFGLFGFPKLGVGGAAVATVLAQHICLLLFYLAYKFRHFPVHFRMRDKLEWAVAANIYNVAIPAGVTLGLPSVLVSALNGIFAAYSSLYIAVLGLYFKIQMFFYLPANGFIQGLRPIVGYNYGAKEYERVSRVIRSALILIFIMMAAGTLVLELIPDRVMLLFAPADDLMAAGTAALRIIAIGFILSVPAIIGNGVFEALGRGQQSLVISLLRQLVIIVPVAWVLVRVAGPAGAWWAFPIAEAAASCVALVLLRKIFRQSHIPGLFKTHKQRT